MIEVKREDFGLDTVPIVNDYLAGEFGAIAGCFCGDDIEAGEIESVCMGDENGSGCNRL